MAKGKPKRKAAASSKRGGSAARKKATPDQIKRRARTAPPPKRRNLKAYRAGAQSANRAPRKNGRALNRNVHGKPRSYIPREKRSNESVERLRRYDFRGLSRSGKMALYQTCLRFAASKIREGLTMARFLVFAGPQYKGAPLFAWTHFFEITSVSELKERVADVFAAETKKDETRTLLLAIDIAWA